MPFSNNTRDDFIPRNHHMVNTEIRLIIFSEAPNGETLYSQQKQVLELTVAQIISSLVKNSGINWKIYGKPSDHSVQFSRSVMSDSLWPHESQHARPPCLSPSPGVHSHSCPSSRWPSSHLILCCPLLLLAPIPPSIRVFSNESTLRMRWPKYWSSSFKEHPGLISFRMD